MTAPVVRIDPILGGRAHYGRVTQRGFLWPVCRDDPARWGEWVHTQQDITCPDCLSRVQE